MDWLQENSWLLEYAFFFMSGVLFKDWVDLKRNNDDK